MLDVLRFEDSTEHLIKNFFTGKLFASYIIRFEEIKVSFVRTNALMERVARANWFIIVMPLSRLIVPGFLLWCVLKISRACVYKLVMLAVQDEIWKTSYARLTVWFATFYRTNFF